MTRAIVAFLFAALAGLFGATAHAHKASDAYLQLQQAGETLNLRWDISLRDLDAVLALDANEDQKLSWGEITRRMPDIRAYALSNLKLEGGRCPLAETTAPSLEDRVDGAYLVLQLSARCTHGDTVSVEYRLFREVDPTHRGLLRVDLGSAEAAELRPLDPSGAPVAVVLARHAGTGMAADTNAAAAGDNTSFFRDGVHHILIGYDHILFLICLLLPAVLRRTATGWQPVARWRDAVWPMVGTVTMFTLGHSLTLALAGMKLVSLSPRVIEPAIALTIIVAALDNIRPVLRGKRRLFTFLFGLIHGFGFAGVLQELELTPGRFLAALLQFNLGVEAGQLIVVSIALAALLAARWWRSYPPAVLRGGSVAAIVVASLWFTERVFDLRLMPF